KVADKQSKPVFPDQAWQGTLFSEFAEVVCRGNSIRTRLASEAFRAITGAIAGDQVLCGIAGVRMREYHAIIANRQSGKSYALDCATDFYTKISIKNIFEPMLMVHSGNNSYRISGIGAQRFLPGSSNSFVDELTREKKHKKGEDVDVLVGPLWKPTARLITIQGEAIALFSRLCSPDWTGQALSALVTDLYDSLDTEVAITKDRATPKLPVRLQYSLLLCRAAMARDWGAIPQRIEITLEDSEAAILLGEYQVRMRQYYAPTPGDSPKWRHLNGVRAAVEQAGQISIRDLRRSVRGDRF